MCWWRISRRLAVVAPVFTSSLPRQNQIQLALSGACFLRQSWIAAHGRQRPRPHFSLTLVRGAARIGACKVRLSCGGSVLRGVYSKPRLRSLEVPMSLRKSLRGQFVRIARVLTIFAVIVLLPGLSLAQTTDPLVGTWNITVTLTSGCMTNCKYIGMAAFNQGGTVVEQLGSAVEYSGLGYVDRTALGKWWRPTTGANPHEFKAKNFVFNSTGVLSATIIGTSAVTV